MHCTDPLHTLLGKLVSLPAGSPWAAELLPGINNGSLGFALGIIDV